MIRNSDSVGMTNFSKGFEEYGSSVMQSAQFGFANVKSIIIKATGFVDNLRFLRAVETTFVRKERLNSAKINGS